MTPLLPSWPLLSTFLLSSLVLALTPGPGVIYIVSVTLAHGRSIGLVSAVGVGLGNLVNALAAILGVAALMALSSTLIKIVQYIGAAYLLYLGGQLWLSKPTSTSHTPSLPLQKTPQSAFWDGFIVALLNPKTTLFYAAFLPQFLTQTNTPVLPGLVLASLFILICITTDSLYALVASQYVSRFKQGFRHHYLSQRLSGSLLIVLGIVTASYRIR